MTAESKQQIRETSLELLDTGTIAHLIHPLTQRAMFWRPAYLESSAWIAGEELKKREHTIASMQKSVDMQQAEINSLQVRLAEAERELAAATAGTRCRQYAA